MPLYASASATATATFMNYHVIMHYIMHVICISASFRPALGAGSLELQPYGRDFNIAASRKAETRNQKPEPRIPGLCGNPTTL